MIDPEVAQASAGTQASPQTAQVDQEPDGDEGDTGPLSHIGIDPAEDGGAVITHHPKVPDRVKAMGMPEHKNHVHVVKSHEELTKHIEKHGKRLKP